MSSKSHVIIVDDEVNICRSVKACLIPEGYQVSDFNTAASAFESMLTTAYDCAIIDIRLGEDSGIKLFEQMRGDGIDIPAIFISGNASLDEAVQSLKLGAYDFIEKPFGADKLTVTVKNCIEYHQLKVRVKDLQDAESSSKPLLVGDHQSMVQLRKDIAKVAKTDAAILISGESGTGKELIAQSIHQQSGRSDQRFIKVNCSSIPENLIDSALFGHVKGAFTGAEQHKKGFFEMADKGTIFLDEIGDMPLVAQTSLLRVLENAEIQKVGADRVQKVNVRVLAASHKNLKQQVEQGLFRADLFYRINVIPLQSPALRERASDIPLLAHHLVEYLAKRHGFAVKPIDKACYPILSQYAWPGNVRELINTLERMLIMSDERVLVDDIPLEIAPDTGVKNQAITSVNEQDLTLKQFRSLWERELLIEKLKQFKGNITHVAKSLGIDRTYLHKKLAQFDISRDQRFK